MQYAPIVITTLNRVEHLQRCLDSLSRNTWAEFTEIFISVDYPPNERYVQGYQLVKEMLRLYDFSSFKKSHVFYQKSNLGPVNNFAYLLEQISDRYDRYISTEDDNEFAPNFIEYIDKGLEFAQKKENLLAVCGAKEANWIYGEANTTFTKLFSAYGYGVIIKRRADFEKQCQEYLMNKDNWKIKNMCSLYKKNKMLFVILVKDILCKNEGMFWVNEKQIRFCDSTMSIYMHLSNYITLTPKIAKSRTWGNDGSGMNMKKRNIDPTKEIQLDLEEKFEFIEPEDCNFNPDNYVIGNRYLETILKRSSVIRAWICYLILKITHYDRNSAIKIIKRITRR